MSNPTLRLEIEEHLNRWCDQNLQDDPVSQACRFILLGRAKRLRSQFLIQIAKAIDPKKNVMKAALAVEMLHSASLIADDLPSMDNSATRRGQEAVHLRFGTNIAILASYQLLFYTYELVAQNAMELGIDKIGPLICLISEQGICAAKGQYDDLNSSNPSLESMIEIIEKKTSTLFHIALCLGCLIANPTFQNLEQIKQIATHVGIAFQMLDDCIDKDEDSLSILSNLTLDETTTVIEQHLSQVEAIMVELGLNPMLLLGLIEPIFQNLKALL